jgi:3-dehydroquinate dehydratase-2
MADILILHGPNLNMLGIRQPELYGHETLKQINTQLELVARQNNVSLEAYQSNAEHELINKIHLAYTVSKLIIINPAGFTHTSVALLDALLSVGLPFIEVHLSNIHARESFRKKSLFSDKAIGVITGFGGQSYSLALYAACQYLKNTSL